MTFRIVLFLLSAIVASHVATGAFAITIYAAASTTDVIQTLADDFERKTGHHVKTVFAGSGTLARQIAQGAPSDLFLSADPRWVDRLEGHIVPSSRRNLFTNQLAIIVPASTVLPDGFKPEDLPSLLNPTDKLALAAPDMAPAGDYARQALTKLNLWEPLKPHMVTSASVRGALAWVERGETPAGITYVSDALNNPAVKVAALIPVNLHDPIRYPLVIIKPAAADAHLFYNHLQTDDAKALFRTYGFKPEPR